MLHPSYMELMESINKEVPSDQPLVQSRYSIVIAAAKRARQITDVEEKTGTGDPKNKPLSQAVKALYEGTTRILTDEEIVEEEQQLEALKNITINFEDANAEISLEDAVAEDELTAEPVDEAEAVSDADDEEESENAASNEEEEAE